MFKRTDTRLYYERSALQAADIYTKACTVPAEWDKATRLINVLNPASVWHDRGDAASGNMGSHHKGSTIFIPYLQPLAGTDEFGHSNLHVYYCRCYYYSYST